MNIMPTFVPFSDIYVVELSYREADLLTTALGYYYFKIDKNIIAYDLMKRCVVLHDKLIKGNFGVNRGFISLDRESYNTLLKTLYFYIEAENMFDISNFNNAEIMYLIRRISEAEMLK